MFDFRDREDINLTSPLALTAFIMLTVFAVLFFVGLFLSSKYMRAKLVIKVVAIIGLIVSLLVTLYWALSFATLIIIAVFVLIAVLGGAIIFYFARTKNKKPLSIALRAIPAVLFLAALAIVLYALLDLQTLSGTLNEDSIHFYTRGNNLILIGLLLVPLVVGLCVTFIALNKYFPFSFTTKDITMAGVLLGLAAALSFVRLFRMPQAGSVTLASTLAIMIFCYFFGFRKGLIMVIAFLAFRFARGDLWILHAWSLLLDYVVPFSTLIFFGIFSFRRRVPWNKNAGAKQQNSMSKKFTLSSHANFFIAFAFYVITRYMSLVLSGILFWGQLEDAVPPGHTAVTWGFLYNTFFLADAAIALVGGVVLLSSKHFNRFMAASANTLQNANGTKENNEAAAAAADEGQGQTCGRNRACNDGYIDESLNGNNGGDTAGEVTAEPVGSILGDTDSSGN